VQLLLLLDRVFDFYHLVQCHVFLVFNYYLIYICISIFVFVFFNRFLFFNFISKQPWYNANRAWAKGNLVGLSTKTNFVLDSTEMDDDAA
jgi:hypothetical protein